MFYQKLVSVAKYLNARNPEIEEILQMFCMREIAELKFVAAYFFQVERDGRLHLNSFYGAQPEEIGLDGEPVEINSDLPWVNCIKDGAVHWVSRAAGSPRGKARFKSIIAWPIRSDHRIVGSFLALLESPVKQDPELKEFVEALAELIEAAIIQNSNGHKKQESDHKSIVSKTDESGQLSERQELILKMISEGRTNGDIADILGYSESLIRQETIRIYAHLNCSGRAEATAIYRDRGGSKDFANRT